ncbi:MAG: hypothetical protein WCL44_07960 [bacterium]
MEFPKGKKERLQIAAFAGVVVIGVLYALVAFVVQPYRASYAEALTKISTLGDQLQAANTFITKNKNSKEKCEEMRSVLREIDAAYILKDEYDNYNIKAIEYLTSTFVVPGVSLDPPTDGQAFVIPRGPRSSLKSFVIPISCRVTGRRSYENLLELFRKIEKSNPYMSISRVNISAALPGTMAQAVSFTISWPIWENPSIATNFLARADASESETSAPSTASGRKEHR